MKNCFLVIVAFFIIQQSVKGQSDPQVSEYMFSMEMYNPSVLANQNSINLVSLNRWQWVGIPNAPQTYFAAASMPFNAFLNKKQGVGIAFVTDDLGLYSNKTVMLQYALQFELNESSLSVGTNIAYISQTFAGDSVRLVESDYHVSSDPSIPTSSVSDAVMDLGFGLMYFRDDYYVGLSVLHLFEPTFKSEEYFESYLGRSAYLVAGSDFALRNVRYVFKPSFLLKTDFISYQTDLTALVEKDEKYWTGLGWRYQDAIVFLGGMSLMNGLSVSFSYDLSTMKIISQSSGSYEFILRYRLNFGKNKLNKYKSVRFL